MFPKLRAAIRKATRRIAGRKEDAATAERRAHHLTREIRELRSEFDALTLRHAETLAKIEAANKAGRAHKDLSAQAAGEAQSLRAIVHKLRHKRDRRGDWRERRRKQLKRYQWWVARRTILRRKLREAKKRWEETHGTPVFETWQLNGCPSNIDEDLKPLIAFQVVACDQYVTATTNGGHTSTSLHYPWNSSDNEGHAVDTGQSSVSSMQAAAEQTLDHFGVGHFLELFSPCPWYVKNGVKLAIFPYFPAHGNHGHYGVS